MSKSGDSRQQPADHSCLSIQRLIFVIGTSTITRVVRAGGAVGRLVDI
jgi:hypothetical protein